MTPFSGVPQRLLGFADLPIQGNDRNSLLLQFVIGGRTGLEIISVISRVGSARDKVNLFRLKMMFQIGRLLRIADLLEDARNPVAHGVPQETKLVLMPGSMAFVPLRFTTHSHQFSRPGTGMDEDVGMEVIGVVVDSIGVSDGIARMELLLESSHRAFHHPFQYHVGIATRCDQGVMEFVRE